MLNCGARVEFYLGCLSPVDCTYSPLVEEEDSGLLPSLCKSIFGHARKERTGQAHPIIPAG